MLAVLVFGVSMVSALPGYDIWGRAKAKEGYGYNFSFFVSGGTVVVGGGGAHYWPKPSLMRYECTDDSIEVRSANIWRWDYDWNDDLWCEECFFEGWAQVNDGSGWSVVSTDPSKSWWFKVTIYDYGIPRENAGEDEMILELWAPGTWSIDLDTYDVTLPSTTSYFNTHVNYEYRADLPLV